MTPASGDKQLVQIFTCCILLCVIQNNIFVTVGNNSGKSRNEGYLH
jgi:hypothetical protein